MRLFFLLILIPISQVYAQPLNSVANNCGQWGQTRLSQSEQATLTWLQGFVSAYNEYKYKGKHPKGVLGTAAPETIARWVDEYCLENPKGNLQKAVGSIIDKRKPMVKACPLKKSSGRPCIPYKEDLPGSFKETKTSQKNN
jgi:hypothetical protein